MHPHSENPGYAMYSNSVSNESINFGAVAQKRDHQLMAGGNVVRIILTGKVEIFLYFVQLTQLLRSNVPGV